MKIGTDGSDKNERYSVLKRFTICKNLSSRKGPQVYVARGSRKQTLGARAQTTPGEGYTK